MPEVVNLMDDAVESPAVVKPATSTLATARDTADLGISGDVGQRDMVIPYLSLVQKSGSRSDTFPVGAWTVGENLVAEKDAVVRVVCLDIQKRYEEVTEFGSGAFPRIFENAPEVRAAGFSMQRGAEKEAREIAGILFWITAPAGADPDLFPLVTSTGVRGTVAKYVARSTSYSGVAMPLFTAVSPLGHLKGCHIKTGQWDLSATLSKSNGNTFYKPALRPKGRTPEDILDIVSGLGL